MLRRRDHHLLAYLVLLRLFFLLLLGLLGLLGLLDCCRFEVVMGYN